MINIERSMTADRQAGARTVAENSYTVILKTTKSQRERVTIGNGVGFSDLKAQP